MSSDITLTGTIEAIEHQKEPEKVTVALRMGEHQKAFIEFRGFRASLALKHHANDAVRVKIQFDGKTSKTNRHYNNLVGRSIKDITDNLKLK